MGVSLFLNSSMMNDAPMRTIATAASTSPSAMARGERVTPSLRSTVVATSSRLNAPAVHFCGEMPAFCAINTTL